MHRQGIRAWAHAHGFYRLDLRGQQQLVYFYHAGTVPAHPADAADIPKTPVGGSFSRDTADYRFYYLFEKRKGLVVVQYAALLSARYAVVSGARTN